MKTWLSVAVAMILSGLLVRTCFPREVETVVQGPPARPETTFVAETTLITDTFFQTRTVFSTDTFNLVQTVVIADTQRIACGIDLPVRKYITEVDVGEVLGDSTWIVGTSFSSDTAGLRFVPYAQSLWTAGPLLGLRAEGDSVRVDFGRYPELKECSFWDRAQSFLIGTGTGIIVRTVF